MRAAMLVSRLRGAVVSLLKSLRQNFTEPVGKYRPEQHYMRGPGPKWRENTFSTTDPLDASERKSPAPYQDLYALRGESPFHNPSRRLTGLPAGAFAMLTAGALG